MILPTNKDNQLEIKIFVKENSHLLDKNDIEQLFSISNDNTRTFISRFVSDKLMATVSKNIERDSSLDSDYDDDYEDEEDLYELEGSLLTWNQICNIGIDNVRWNR